jgi:hypothetical protein
MKITLLVCIILSLLSCKGKPSLSTDDADYVHTTLDLMRVRARIAPGTDSTRVKSMLDSAYRRHHTSREAYLKYTGQIGEDPKRAETIYNAINDSIGTK